MRKPPKQDSKDRTQGTAQGPRPNPRNPLGCSYALVPARLLDLPPGELVVLSWLLAAKRKTCCLGYTLAELGAATGFCSRTVQAHVASLRAKGLVERDNLRAAPAALVQRKERHARVSVRDLMAQPTGAAWRLHLHRMLHTDSRGRLRVSRRYLAERMGRSTRAVRDGFRKLRAFGIAVPGRLAYGEESGRCGVDLTLDTVFDDVWFESFEEAEYRGEVCGHEAELTPPL